ncbi:protein arginine kinase [Clostridium sp. Cult3]|uniref:protein arginine kinase n=1 Tax=Clostridium sp. Cult3 TaxID=2079004 RepID=UPI001F0186D5|nr:protein arginine kinase [Clostridium sp. Cult3]MCF6461429.1 protein arginine kinase [Clostridium sp. Cult3]
MTRWFEGSGLEEDVVVSTRIRIARNLENYRFPQKMSIEESEKLTQEVLNAMKNLSSNHNYKFIRISNLSPLQKVSYMEEHLISPGLIQKSDLSSFLLRDDEMVTIMINEEDHLRTQVLLPGLNFEDGWKHSNDIDDFLDSFLNFAFHEDFGYLTTCPTNVGTGLRASAMVHIPSLVMTGHINNLIRGLNKIGLTVRGLYGEGTEAIGDLYQISNQTTLGEEEEKIIEKLKNVIYQVINKERNIRDELINRQKNQLEDRIFRSLGILRYSRIISSKEAMKHLSNVRLGVEMGIINDMKFKDITELMIGIQPASIQKRFNIELNKNQRDIERATLIREYMSV